jgi:DNA repair protein RadC
MAMRKANNDDYKETKLNINQWAEEDRPREKMERLGAQVLSDAELLAILVGSGSAKEDAVALMKRILNDCNNNLNTLGKLTVRELCQYNGVGPAKAITILAACELGKRRQMESPEERPQLSTATRVYNHMHPLMQDMDVEEFWVLYLNQDHKLIKKVRIAHGGISEVSVDVRIIMREAVICNATILVVCHNHPSGQITPSPQDNALTLSIKNACELMRYKLMDHVIVADGHYYSYKEAGVL